MPRSRLIKLTLLLTSMMTMMAGAVVAPSLPQIKSVFIDHANIELLSRLVITLPALFIAIFSPIIGILADRFGRKKLLIGALMLYAVSGTSGYFLEDIYAILLGRAFLGIAVAGNITIISTLIGDYYQGEERYRYVGLQGAFMGVGGVVFLSLSGWVANIHWQAPFLIYLYAIPVLLLAMTFLYEPQSARQLTVNQTLAPPHYDKLLAWLICLLTFFAVAFFFMIPVQIPFLLQSNGVEDNSKYGYAIALSNLVAAIVASNYSRIIKYLSFRQLFQFAFVIMALGYLLISQAQSYAAVLWGLAVAGISMGMLMPSGNLWTMEIAPNAIRATLLGRVAMAIFIGQFLSPILFAPIISQVGISQAFLVVALLLIASAVVVQALKTILERYAKPTKSPTNLT